MAGTAQSLSPITDDGAIRSPRARIAEWGPTLLAVLALVALLVALLPALRAQRDRLKTVPETQRIALFTRTVDELRQFCGPERPEALDAHCRELASFAVQFEECRDDCRALVRPHVAPRPTR